MKDLQQIKNEVARRYNFLDFEQAVIQCGTQSLIKMVDIIANEYAEQYKAFKQS